MKYTTPEKAGISSAAIKQYLDILEEHQLSTHNILIARGDEILFEKYWEPFHADFLHRMYSVSKSIVSLAVGFAMQDGLLSLDDPIGNYFPEEMAAQKDENMRNQTIRHMLMMSTAKLERGWFEARTEDRVKFYFANDRKESRPSGTIFQYDSTGSFVMGAMVERLTGKPFMEYLREKLFDKIGVSKEAHCLKCPGGHSWGDSAVLCKPRDLYLIARFVMNGGKWNGEQLLNEEYVTAAVSRQIDNNPNQSVHYSSFGYGYQIWRTYDNSWFFYGMGCQFAIGVPDKDLIFIYNGDNQGNDGAQEIVIGNFFKCIARTAQNVTLPENPKAYESLKGTCQLMTAKGEAYSEFQEKINGVEFNVLENPMGITKFSLDFAEDGCRFNYTNRQGEKSLAFGMCRNEFGYFPEEGYSDQVGSQKAPGHYYKCAASAAWVEPKKLLIKVQVIDEYFGRLDIVFGFIDEKKVGIYMQKTAEDFFNEYVGYATGISIT